MKIMTLEEARQVANQINEIIEHTEWCGVNVFAEDANGVGPARCYVIHDENAPEDQFMLGVFPVVSVYPQKTLHEM